MPYVTTPKKKWPKWITLSVILGLLTAALLLLPFSKPIQESHPCTKITYTGDISSGGEITLDLRYKRYLVRDSRISGQILLPDGTTVKIFDHPVIDLDLGTYTFFGWLYIGRTNDIHGVNLHVSEDLQSWLIQIQNDSYLISSQQPETAEELNDIFPGFHVWPPNMG